MGNYADNVVLQTDPTNLIGYWQLDETSGTSADDSSAENNDATYNANVILMDDDGPHSDTRQAPYLNGMDAAINLYSAAFNTDFDGNEGTFSGWFKVDSGVWTDGSLRILAAIRVDGNNEISIQKSSTNNRLFLLYKVGGVTAHTTTTLPPAGQPIGSTLP